MIAALAWPGPSRHSLPAPKQVVTAPAARKTEEIKKAEMSLAMPNTSP
jgi:hypothetical protein